MRQRFLHSQRTTLLVLLSTLVVLLSAVGLIGFGVVADGASRRHSSGRHAFLTGFTDLQPFLQLDRPQRLAAFSHAGAARASVIRLGINWRWVAWTRPPDPATARNPGFRGYHWGVVDTPVREASAAGFRVLLSWTGAPDWAEGSGRPSRAPAGSWRPSAAQYRLFAEAAARRYSGSYRDSSGARLPRVRYWQAWNEPNLSDYLTPQWRRVNGRWAQVSPTLYRRLLNAFYAGVKAVHRSNYVVSAGTAPFGEPRRGGPRMPPALFTRTFLCVKGRRHPRPTRCSSPRAHFDALAHHPYPIGEPRHTAINPDDVVIADLSKLTRPLRVAIRAHKVAPARRKGFWVTEFSWDTNPPDPRATPIRRQARFLEGAFYTLWRQGVSVMVWFIMRDQPPTGGYQNTLQSGVYFRGSTVQQDRRKQPSFQAFRFPFTAYTQRRVAQIWGLAPNRGRVAIEVRRHGRWRLLERLRTHPGRLFFDQARLRRGTLLRARQGHETSLAFRVGPVAVLPPGRG